MSVMLAEAGKIPAFIRRDFLVMLSYRAAFTSDLLFIGVQAVLFGFVAELVDPAKLPTYGDTQASYFDFVMIGVVFASISGLLLQRVATAMRAEQMIGTLEAVLVSPVSPGTVQAGSVAFDIIFIPIRMGALLLAVSIGFGLGYDADGILPSLTVMTAFVPFLWGLGLLTGAVIVTFRRGTGFLAVLMSVLGLASGAFFPLALLPQWLQTFAEANPVAIAMEATREALIGGTGWEGVAGDLAVLIPISAATVAAGVWAFRAALGREHRRGTLGLY
jgi:ABC-2 type transport system permease protein